MQTPGISTTLRLFAALFLGAEAARAAGNTDDRWATLEAIHNLENPRNLTRPGPCGELGAYQFREATWRHYTTEPFFRARERPISDAIAIRHYDWLKVQLEHAHVPVNSYNIALAWNGGIRAAVTGRAPRAAFNYAERAANLAATFAQESVVADAR